MYPSGFMSTGRHGLPSGDAMSGREWAMGYPTRLSDAIHILLYIHVDPSDDLSSAAIADSVRTHPSYVRQLMSALRKAGLLDCARGQATPSLARPVERISLLDVYRAVEGDKPLLHQDTDTNPDCGVGVCVRNAVRDCFDEIQRTAEHAMDAISLAEVMRRFRCDGECRCDPERCPCAGRCGSPHCGKRADEAGPAPDPHASSTRPTVR